MQFINSDQQRISTADPANELFQQLLTLEQAQDEIMMLREQIDSLQQFLSEQLQQQQAVEQELQDANQEIALMNVENQQLFAAKWLCLEEIKEFVRNSSSGGKIDSKALLSLLNRFHDEVAPFRELESLRSA